MIDFGERKDLLVLFVLGVLIVIGIFIFSIIMIWFPKTIEEEFKVGIVDTSKLDITDEYKAYQYVKRISKYFKNEEYDELYKLLAKDYVDYSKITVDLLKTKIKALNLNGQELIMESVKARSLDKYKNVLVTNVRGKDNDKSLTIIIKEITPRQFELSLDDLIYYDTPSYSKSAENVLLTINSIKYTANSINYNITLKNNTSNNIELNYGKYGINCFMLKYMDESISSKIVLSNDSFKIEPGGKKEYEVSFESSSVDFRYIIGLTIKNVKFTNEKISDLLFKFI